MSILNYEFKNGATVIRDGTFDTDTTLLTESTAPSPVNIQEEKSFIHVLDTIINHMTQYQIDSVEIA